MDLSQFAFDFNDEATPKKAEAKPVVPKKVKPLSPPVLAQKPKSTRGRKSLKSFALETDLIDVPDDESLFKKSYYSIGDVAQMFKLNASQIRFWANEFDILKPKKNAKGDRHFRPEDVKNLNLIYHLLRERKYTIEGAKDFLKKSKGASEKFEMISSLKKLRSFLLELKSSF